MRTFCGKRRPGAALAAAAGLVVVAPCGDAEPQTYATPMSGMSMQTSPSTSGARAVVAIKRVTIKNFAFSPASITVKVGTTVIWTNGDQDPHNVISQQSRGPLRSPTMNKGNTYKYTFTKTGRYAYVCTIHPSMTGTVVVTR
jgi:plastocyanin